MIIVDEKIIPTPASLSYGESFVTLSEGRVNVSLQGEVDEKAKFAANFLIRAMHERWGISVTKVKGALEILLFNAGATDKFARDFEKLTDAADRGVFEKPLALEQGYVLKAKGSGKGGRILIVAKSSQGLQYGAATLLQLIRLGGDGPSCREVVIWDYPDFRYRGNIWQIWGPEIGCWSYDWGDGIEAYMKRIERKLDLCLLYKVNVVNIDGFGWNRERFPGYGKMMRRLNLQARLRGIKLLYGGYGQGYGASVRGLYDGQVFFNRRRYPDGPVYECVGYSARPGRPHGGREHGTCISNQELAKLKQEELREFVRAVEPGALYIHNVDFDAVPEIWKNRCEECRKNWPNDDLTAPDGMAGAYAHHYDTLCDAAFSVKNSETGYDAARDCTAIMVSPGYTGYDQSDEQWEFALKYWATISRTMRNVKNVEFGFREQFYRHEEAKKRLLEMKENLEKNGKGHGSCGLIWYGGDNYINDQLFLAAPTLTKMYEGAEMILNGSGRAYQEPLQLLNAEYGWRSEGSAFYNDDAEPNYQAVIARFGEYRDAKRRPEALFGRRGFLENACAKLYGPEAGKPMAEVFRALTAHGDAPTPFMKNIQFGNSGGVKALWPIGEWSLNLPPGIATERAERYKALAELNARCAAEAGLAASAAGLPAETREDLDWFWRCLLVGYRFASLLANYFQIYSDTQELLEGKRGLAKGVILQRMEDLHAELEEFQTYLTRNFSFKTIDYLGADLSGWPRLVGFMGSQLKEIKKGVETGARGKPMREFWW